MNRLLLTDSYKLTHWKQYPPRTSRVYSYFESRQGAKFPKTVFFGLQYLLKKYLEGVFVTKKDVDEAELLAHAHFGVNHFNRRGWDRILISHDGRLPVSIKAVPEGSVVETGNVLMTIENTDAEFYWLPNYLETLLVQMWYPCTVATQSYFMKQALREFWEKSSDDHVASLDFKLHDFGCRGVSSMESAGIGGAAHLTSFKGTDTLPALWFARKYYSDPMAAFSIPAAEHSTITSWGQENEQDAFENMLNQYPTGLVAVVSDSYDIERACRELWGANLKAKVMGRNGTLVIRPDSGHPPDMVSKVLAILGECFGTETNSKGFKVLHPKVRIIQGDGIDYDMMKDVIARMEKELWAIDNIAFGSGGGLLQKLNRDTQRFAFKCSQVTVNGEERPVMKNPKSDPAKASKSGRLALTKTNTGYQTISGLNHPNDCLIQVFRNGTIQNPTNLSEIRNLITIQTLP